MRLLIDQVIHILVIPLLKKIHGIAQILKTCGVEQEIQLQPMELERERIVKGLVLADIMCHLCTSETNCSTESQAQRLGWHFLQTHSFCL